jgi:hypothetical protein
MSRYELRSCVLKNYKNPHYGGHSSTRRVSSDLYELSNTHCRRQSGFAVYNKNYNFQEEPQGASTPRCGNWKKEGHTHDKCWFLHFKLWPKKKEKRRGSAAMAIKSRRRRGAWLLNSTKDIKGWRAYRIQYYLGKN